MSGLPGRLRGFRSMVVPASRQARPRGSASGLLAGRGGLTGSADGRQARGANALHAASGSAPAATLGTAGRDSQRVTPHLGTRRRPTGEARAAVGCSLRATQRIDPGLHLRCPCARRIAGPKATTWVS